MRSGRNMKLWVAVSCQFTASSLSWIGANCQNSYFFTVTVPQEVIHTCSINYYLSRPLNSSSVGYFIKCCKLRYRVEVLLSLRLPSLYEYLHDLPTKCHSLLTCFTPEIFPTSRSKTVVTIQSEDVVPLRNWVST